MRISVGLAVLFLMIPLEYKHRDADAGVCCSRLFLLNLAVLIDFVRVAALPSTKLKAYENFAMKSRLPLLRSL